MPKHLIAACDGACKGNPGPAAWGWVVADSHGTVLRWQGGPLGTATNNVAELTALQQLLSAVESDADLEVRMDSQYAMNAVTTWLPKWKRNGWKTAGNKPVANQSLVMAIDTLLTGRRVKFVYVPAHQVDGDPLNDIADRVASASAVSQRAAGGTGAGEVPEAVESRRASPSAAGGGAAQAQASGPPRGMKARYSGNCGCGKGYKAGEVIAKLPTGGWGHLACATG